MAGPSQLDPAQFNFSLFWLAGFSKPGRGFWFAIIKQFDYFNYSAYD